MDKVEKAKAHAGLKGVMEYVNRLELQVMLLHSAVKANDGWHKLYDDHGGYGDSAMAQINEAALAVELPDPVLTYPVGMVLRNNVEVGTDSIQAMTRVVQPGAQWVVKNIERGNRSLRCITYNTWLETDEVELAENFTILSIGD